MSTADDVMKLVDKHAKACGIDEQERCLAAFAVLAKQMTDKAEADEGEAGLVWTAAAASILRVCDEVVAATPSYIRD